MIPTSAPLNAWLKHISGEEKMPIATSARLKAWLNAVPADPTISSGRVMGTELTLYPYADTFGRKQFYAFVGFVDICGFTELAFGKSPVEVRDIVAPFIQSVISIKTYWPLSRGCLTCRSSSKQSRAFASSGLILRAFRKWASAPLRSPWAAQI